MANGLRSIVAISPPCSIRDHVPAVRRLDLDDIRDGRVLARRDAAGARQCFPIIPFIAHGSRRPAQGPHPPVSVAPILDHLDRLHHNHLIASRAVAPSPPPPLMSQPPLRITLVSLTALTVLLGVSPVAQDGSPRPAVAPSGRVTTSVTFDGRLLRGATGWFTRTRTTRRRAGGPGRQIVSRPRRGLPLRERPLRRGFPKPTPYGRGCLVGACGPEPRRERFAGRNNRGSSRRPTKAGDP